MLIGIDASRAFVKNRTGIEEYSYQVIKNLVGKLDGHEVVLYLRHGAWNIEYKTKTILKNSSEKFKLPKNWKVKIIKWPRFWTQIGLSLEMLFHPVDVLFISAHTVPIIHPKNTAVVIHGLEYEFCPEAYSWWEKFYMRRVIKNSCRWASKIISVSENTKQDLMKLYKVPEEKIEVIYEGVNLKTYNSKLITQERNLRNKKSSTLYALRSTPYLLFIGRLEKRKNITGIVKAFEILKEKYNIPHKLVLAGGKGYSYESIKYQISSSKYKGDIIETGYVSEENKWELLRNADVFLFPTFYEGFGLPILEAQNMGTPVMAGDNSSIPEVVNLPPSVLSGHLPPKGGEEYSSALLVDSHNPEEVADAAYKLISDKDLRNDIIEKGYKNVKRFSWEKCAGEVAELLMVANDNE